MTQEGGGHVARTFGWAGAMVGLVVPGLLATSAAAVPANPTAGATLTVLHAIPSGRGVDVVDVYAEGRLVADNLTPGRLASVQVPGGVVDLAVVADGRSPATSSTLLSLPRLRVSPGGNVTVAAHLTGAGAATLTAFANDTSTVGNGKGRLTVRHVADAPPVDVRLDGSMLIAGLRSPRQATAGLPAREYSVDLVATGTRRVVLGPVPVTIKNRPGRDDMGTHTIVYVWGSSDEGTLRTTLQEVRIDLR